MLRLLNIFILVSPAAVCLVWLAESGRLRRAFSDTARALRGLPPGRAAALAVLVLWATISGGDKQMSAPPPAAPGSAVAELQPEAAPEAPLLSGPESGGWPWAMPLWPFDAVVSNAVAGLSATNVPPIPDAMLDSGLALYRAAVGVALEPRAPDAVPAYAWERYAADNRGLEFALPFSFPLGTNAYGRIGVLSNGRLSFGFHTLHRRTPGGIPFATPYPVATLAPLWGPYGLLPSAGSGVWAQGGPDRFTVCWQGMLLHGDTNLPATVQCDLLPGGAVRFRYGAIPGGTMTNSTVGVQNLGPGWSFGGAAAPVFAGLELALRPVAAAGWADADPDGDGLTNFEEFMIGTDEHLADTDGDGPSDSWEPAHGFDPLVPQFPDPEPDADNDGVPDRWAQWMGERLGDATNYYTFAALCADGDGDGFTGWYELFALESNPAHAASPDPAPAGFVDVVAVVTSSLPCVLRLTGEAGSAEIPWMPGLSPERVRLRLEVGKAFQTELSRVPSDTAFPANGFWWAGLVSFEVPDFENQPPVVVEGETIYTGGRVRVTTPDRAGDLWQTPGEAEAPPAAVEVWTVNVDGPHLFCHSSGYAEVTVLTNSLYSGGIVWSSIPDGIEGEDNPLVIDPGEIPPGSYTVYAVSEENPAVTGETTVVISHLGLTETTVYVAYGDTNLTAIGISGDTYPQADITVTSDPPGISDLSFRASDLEPGTYTVTVDNGSCETRETIVVILQVNIIDVLTYTDSTNSTETKYQIATVPGRENSNTWSACLQGTIDRVDARIKYRRAGNEADVTWIGPPADTFFVNGDLNVTIALLDGCYETPRMVVNGGVLEINSVQQGDRIIVEDEFAVCRDELAVVKNFTWNDLQRIGVGNLSFAPDFSGLESTLKTAVIEGIIFTLDQTVTREQRSQRTNDVMAGVTATTNYPNFQTATNYAGLCSLDIPSALGIGCFPPDFMHWHMALETNALPDELASEIVSLHTLGTNYRANTSINDFEEMQEGTNADLVRVLNMAATSEASPVLIWHTYEGNVWKSIPLTARYVDPVGIDTLDPSDPIRNIKAYHSSATSSLFYPGQRNDVTWAKLPPVEVWQPGLYIRHNGQIIITATGYGDYLFMGYGQILDACKQE